MPYDAQIIANAIIKIAEEDECREKMTNLKLQKILYYEQAYHLARFGQPLFDDEIEAWRYGPVVPRVYDKYASYGRDPLPVDYNLGIDDMTDDEINLFFEVFETYSNISAYGLMKMTHNERPWLEAARSLGRGSVMSKETIQNYFVDRITSANI